MKYYLIAGERSGDLHGGNLIKAIRKYDPDAVTRAFGGNYMAAAGAELAVHYEEMAVMGFGEIVFRLRKILGYIRKCKADILEFNPDVIILIDYAGFNMQIAKFGKKRKFRVYYYITPKIWAWYQRRAYGLKANVDRMFVILPFEKEFFKKYDWDVDYVGNPVLDAVRAHVPSTDFLSRHQLPSSRTLVALLPGSRRQELENMVPVLAEVAGNFPAIHFGVAAIDSADPRLYEPFKKLPNVSLVVEDTYNLLLNARAAVVTSGTATLETGLLKVPQVVVYKANPMTFWFVRTIIKVQFISLINLIAGREVVRELIQSKANAREISRELEALTGDEIYRAQVISDYEMIYKTLDTGAASDNAARLIVAYLK